MVKWRHATRHLGCSRHVVAGSLSNLQPICARAPSCVDLDAVVPRPRGLLAVGVDHDPGALLLPVAPLAAVLAAVRPSQGALALPQVLLVAALVARAIGPLHGAVAVHVAPVPLAVVGAAIGEVVGALAVHLVVVELTLEDHRAGARLVGAHAVLAAVQELALVLAAVRPALDALAALLVLGPLAVVRAAVLVNVPALAVGAVLVPLSLVDVTVGGHELAVAVSSAHDEGPLVPRAVGPAQDAVAVALVSLPLALVLCAGLHLRLRALLQLLPVLLAGQLLVERVGGGARILRLVRVPLHCAARAAFEERHDRRVREAESRGETAACALAYKPSARASNS
mmetsp:Transcript_37883/g.82509  ORF Transcript_37883/g.82509 Transcript_37883/m.82509 type:complete len:340 (+) Transcript_37883:145-1164(+)